VNQTPIKSWAWLNKMIFLRYGSGHFNFLAILGLYCSWGFFWAFFCQHKTNFKSIRSDVNLPCNSRSLSFKENHSSDKSQMPSWQYLFYVTFFSSPHHVWVFTEGRSRLSWFVLQTTCTPILPPILLAAGLAVTPFGFLRAGRQPLLNWPIFCV